MLGPIIRGERVILGPLLPEYAPNYCRWFADTMVTHYLFWRNPPTEAGERAWIEDVARDPNAVVWALTTPDGQHIGSTGLHGIDWRHRHADSGIIIGEPAFWGRGIATEAMRLRTAYAFRELGLEKVSTHVFDDNVGSRTALMKAGYREIGWARRHVFFDGRWHDTWLGEILREDWEQGRG